MRARVYTHAHAHKYVYTSCVPNMATALADTDVTAASTRHTTGVGQQGRERVPLPTMVDNLTTMTSGAERALTKAES